MYYFSSYQLALSQLISFDPFEVTYNNHQSLFTALCETKGDFSSGSITEKLLDTACVAVILNMGIEPLHKIDRKLLSERKKIENRRTKRHTRPISHCYRVTFFKRIKKLIVTDSLGYKIDISELNQTSNLDKCKHLKKTIHHYLVRSGILRELDVIKLTVRMDRQMP